MIFLSNWTERQVAWLALLGDYDYEIQHRKGTSHSNADAISRHPCLRKPTCPACHPGYQPRKCPATRGNDSDDDEPVLDAVAYSPRRSNYHACRILRQKADLGARRFAEGSQRYSDDLGTEKRLPPWPSLYVQFIQFLSCTIKMLYFHNSVQYIVGQHSKISTYAAKSFQLLGASPQTPSTGALPLDPLAAQPQTPSSAPGILAISPKPRASG